LARHGTHYRAAAELRNQGAYVRAGIGNYNGYFTGAWYNRYGGAWAAAGWRDSDAWRAANWGTVAGWGGYSAEPTYYDYGSSAVYNQNYVYVNGEQAGSTYDYYQQATTIADASTQAQPARQEQWLPLGVFAMAQGEETTSHDLFQLALSKEGIIRGNYYNALTDTTEPVSGAVDRKTQRAAWIVGARKFPVYDAGIANLTRDETTIMVHYKDRSQQFTLFRLEQPQGPRSN
jgi:hypothetical protein